MTETAVTIINCILIGIAIVIVFIVACTLTLVVGVVIGAVW